MNKSLAFIASTLITSALFTGCSVKHPTTVKVSNDLLNTASITGEAEVELLSTKLIQADYTWMGLNSTKTIKQVLEHVYGRPASSRIIQCTFKAIDRDNYKNELNEVALYLSQSYPDDVRFFIYKLGELRSVTKKIFEYPKPVTFNTNNILNSSALKILKQSEAVMLMNTMKDRKYRPLLAVVGLPTISDSGVIEDLSISQIGSMIEIIVQANTKCGK